MNPNIAGRKPPNLAQVRRYNVNRAGEVEVIWSPRYDRLAYPAAGVAQLTFFQTPFGAAANGQETTNIDAAGQIPRPQEFLITGLQVIFYGGSAASVTAAAARALPNWNDTVAVLNTGWLDLFIGSKSYLIDAPIGKFISTYSIGGAAMISVDGGVAVAQSDVDYARGVGKYYSITPVKLPANQNFRVTLNWNTVVPTPSTVAGEIQVILDGFLYRLSQ